MRNTITRRRGMRMRYKSGNYTSRFLQDLQDFPEAPSIISEGDSWFAYPFGRDLNDWIVRSGNFNIRRLEKAGDELIDDMMDGRQKKLLTRAFKRHQFELLLYSGGGNDIVAENLENYICDDESGYGPHNRIDEAAITARMAELSAHYVELIELVAKYQNNCPIIAHGYDNIIPSDEGFRIFGVQLAGPWVKPTLDRKGIKPEHQAEVINFIMGLFNDILIKLADKYDKFYYIDLRGTLTKKSDWANEIHPTSRGFGKLAVHYTDLVKQLVPSAF
ncbi:MAG: hypothetical protein ACI9FJ_002275 [Alteromonadaceae bacterium]|jgi:hypothetical protein